MNAAIADGIEAAPALGRLIDDDVVTELTQLACNATEKMRVAIVPAGGECMIKQDAFHACTSIV
jgi:hypothetical protein